MLITVLSAGSVDVACVALPVDRKERHDPVSSTASTRQRSAKTRPDRVVYAGVDAHKELHVAEVVDGTETVPGTRSFSTTRAGYRAPLAYIAEFGDLARIGVEVIPKSNDHTTYYPPRGPAHGGADHASASSVAGQVVTGVGRDAATR